jgi:hypothetical protein
MISPRQDYFCRPCRASFCLFGDIARGYQLDLERPFELPAERLYCQTNLGRGGPEPRA